MTPQGKQDDTAPSHGILKAAFEKAKSKAVGPAMSSKRPQRRRQAPASHGEQAAPGGDVEVIDK